MFPTACADPTMIAVDLLSKIIADLVKVLQYPPTTSPVFNSQRELYEAIKIIKLILERDDTNKSVTNIKQ